VYKSKLLGAITKYLHHIYLLYIEKFLYTSAILAELLLSKAFNPKNATFFDPIGRFLSHESERIFAN
jgi:hypothetical protein